MNATHRRPNQYESLLAGIVAGGVEGAVTYPAEYLKTRAQFTANKGQAVGVMTILRETLRERGVKGLYSGAGALIVGNSLKAGVRFVTYDSVKTVFADHEVSSCLIALISGQVDTGSNDARGTGCGRSGGYRSGDAQRDRQVRASLA
jgi:hypothetical protein